MWHSKSYHRYFEGYSERKYIDINGRQKYEKYYTGDLYDICLTKQENTMRKLEYVGRYSVALISFIVASVLDTKVNSNVFVGSSILLILLGFIWLVPSLFTIIFSSKKLKAGEFRESGNLMALCMGITIALSCSALARLFCVLLIIKKVDNLGILTALICLLDAAMIYGIYKKEKKLQYIKEMTNTKVPFDSYDITYNENSNDYIQ